MYQDDNVAVVRAQVVKRVGAVRAGQATRDEDAATSHFDLPSCYRQLVRVENIVGILVEPCGPSQACQCFYDPGVRSGRRRAICGELIKVADRYGVSAAGDQLAVVVHAGTRSGNSHQGRPEDTRVGSGFAERYLLTLARRIVDHGHGYGFNVCRINVQISIQHAEVKGVSRETRVSDIRDTIRTTNDHDSHSCAVCPAKPVINVVAKRVRSDKIRRCRIDDEIVHRIAGRTIVVNYYAATIGGGAERQR